MDIQQNGNNECAGGMCAIPGVTPGYAAPQQEPSVRVTTVQDLQKYSQGTVVELPAFAEGQPFVARLRRPSMLVLAKSGKIPNSLLSAANGLFTKGNAGLDADDDRMMADAYDVTHIVAEAALLEPTLKDIESVGMELSDEQLMAIFSYTQVGIKGLESFRQE